MQSQQTRQRSFRGSVAYKGDMKASNTKVQVKDSQNDPKLSYLNSQTPRSRIYRQPCRQRSEDGNLHVYLFEVHDFKDNKEYGERFWGNVRDITGQSSVEVPLSMTKSLIEYLMTSKVDEAELEHDEEDEKECETEEAPAPSLFTQFDLDNLENKRFLGVERSFALEITDSTASDTTEGAVPGKLLTCESLGKDSEPNAGGDAAKNETATDLEERRSSLKPGVKKGSLLITEWLVPRLILFLRDISIRHMAFVNGRPEVRSLYAPSGSRRFFFDIHETYWGARLQISQVTSRHRNNISVPMESLVLFRNRLNRLIENLSLDELSDLKVPRNPRPRRPRQNGSVPRRGRLVGGRPVRVSKPLTGRRFRPRPIKAQGH